MTSSARASTDGGMVRPSALAVLRLMTSSNLVGCSTGRSAGLEPLRDLCHIGSGASIEISEIRAVAHEGACLRPRRGLGDSREAVLRGKLKESRAEWSSDNMHPKGIGPL